MNSENKRAHAFSRSGFTIVELLIVVVVIAILAAITIVAYNGVQTRAVESTMKNDLQSAATLVEMDNTKSGSYPSSAGSANDGKGLNSSGSNILNYALKSYGYCLTITNPKSSKTFQLKSDDRQIDEGGCGTVVGTLAGSGQAGFQDGAGAVSRFYAPNDVAVGSDGTTYVSDRYNSRIRKITPAGVVSTFAGSGEYGSQDGPGATAQFGSLSGLAVDSSGTIYAADEPNNRIRKIE